MIDKALWANRSVEVVIVTYQSAGHLPDLFAALPEGLPVTVVDNASSDGSAEVAEAYGARVVRGAVNAGFAAACNRGAALGEADLVLFLNPDAVIARTDLERLLAAFDDPTVGVASPRLRNPDGSPQRARWPFPSPGAAWGEAVGLGAGRHGPEGGFVVGACFAVRRSAFEAVGGFDTRFWLYGEEAELCRRLAEDWRIVLVEDAEAHHIGKASVDAVPRAGVTDHLVDEHFLRGGEHLVVKHHGRRGLVSYRLASLAGAARRSLLQRGARGVESRWRVGRLARVLTTSPTTVDLDSPATRAPGVGLVVCSLEAWDDVWRRNQFLVRELLAQDPDRRVLFVEPAFDVLHERRLARGRVHQRGLRPLPEDGRVVRFEPVKWLPRRLGPWADRHRDRQVRRAVAQLGFEVPTLWVNDPGYASLAERVPWPSLYDITDDWVAAGDARVAASAAADEARLFRCCAAVVVCSPDLARSRRAVWPDLVVVPNAVDADHLRAPRSRPADLPPGPVAVYVGTLHTDRLDVDLVVDLAAARPDLTVVLVGPDALSAEASTRLAAVPNVVRTGPRPYRDVPGYLQHADVLVVPHVVTSFTESLDPIKAYECLAMGRPTVATPVAGFRGETAPIHVAERAVFVETVLACLADPGEAIEREVPTWTERAEEFAAALRQARKGAPERRLRVAFFDHCAQLSGGELALARVLPAMADVDPVVLLGESGPLEATLQGLGIEVEVLALDEELLNTRRGAVGVGSLPLQAVGASIRDIRTLARRLRQLRPDVLHTNSLKAALLGGVAGRLAGVPVLWHIRDRIADDYLPGAAVRLVRAAGWVLPSAVIANSATTRATLGRRWSLRSTVLHDAVPQPDPTVVPRALDASSGPICVAMVGRISPWKGQEIFIDAFAQAFGGGDDTALIVGSAMFGEDDLAGALVAQVTERGVADQITFTGFVEDVPALLRDCDVLVHASTIPEPFGQVVLEGMAAGLAVIASDSGGPAEVVNHGVDGLLVPPGDVDALAAALRRLRENPAERRALATAGLARVCDFAPEALARKVIEVYRSMVRPRSERD